jgi:hypothetical protein
MVRTFGMSMACLWSPALAYGGLRTGNTADVVIGLGGVASLAFWIPWIVYH